MASHKASLSVSPESTLIEEQPTVSAFVWKSVGAAICGAAIPGIIFYFLF